MILYILSWNIFAQVYMSIVNICQGQTFISSLYSIAGWIMLHSSAIQRPL